MRRRDTRAPTVGPIKPEADITLAARFPVPVLITAPPDRAIAVAQAIAGGTTKRPRLVMCDGAAIVSRALAEPRARREADGDDVLVVREVHALTDTEQAALLLLLFDGEQIASRRIISTSSVCLLDRVRRGTFDAVLFYRLNTIHIMSPSSSDGVGSA